MAAEPTYPSARIILRLADDKSVELSDGYYYSNFLRNAVQDLGGTDEEALVVPMETYDLAAVELFVEWCRIMNTSPSSAMLMSNSLFQMDEATFVETVRNKCLSVSLAFDPALCVFDDDEEVVFRHWIENTTISLKDILYTAVFLDCPIFYRRLLFFVRWRIQSNYDVHLKSICQTLCPHNNHNIFDRRQWIDFLDLAGVNPQAAHITGEYSSGELRRFSLPIEREDAMMLMSFEGGCLVCTVCGHCCSEEEIPKEILDSIGVQRVACSSDTLRRYSKWTQVAPPRIAFTIRSCDEFAQLNEYVLNPVEYEMAHNFSTTWEMDYRRRILFIAIGVMYTCFTSESEYHDRTFDALTVEEVQTHIHGFIEIIEYTKNKLFQIHMQLGLLQWRQGIPEREEAFMKMVSPIEKRDDDLAKRIANTLQVIETGRLDGSESRGILAGFGLVWQYVEYVNALNQKLASPYQELWHPVVKYAVPNEGKDLTELERMQWIGRGGFVDEFTRGMNRRQTVSLFYDHTVELMYAVPNCEHVVPARIYLFKYMAALFLNDKNLDWEVINHFESTEGWVCFKLSYLLDVIDLMRGEDKMQPHTQAIQSLFNDLSADLEMFEPKQQRLCDCLLEILKCYRRKPTKVRLHWYKPRGRSAKLNRARRRVDDAVDNLDPDVALDSSGENYEFEVSEVRTLKCIANERPHLLEKHAELAGFLQEVEHIERRVAAHIARFKELFKDIFLPTADGVGAAAQAMGVVEF